MNISTTAVKAAMVSAKGDNKALLKSLARMPDEIDDDMDDSNDKKKRNKNTSNHLFRPDKTPELETAKRGTWNYYSANRTPWVKKGGKTQTQFNFWNATAAGGKDLLRPLHLKKQDIRDIINRGALAPADEEIEKQKEKIELDKEVQEIQNTVVMTTKQDPYTFPNTEYQFDMADAVRSSIMNYKKAKSKWNVQADSGDKASRLMT